jgi:hypothetical protein
MGGLVDHHDLARAQPTGGIAAAAGLVEEFGHRVGRDPGLVGQNPGGHGGDGQAPQAVPRPDIPGGAHHAGLPGAGGADHTGEPFAAFADPLQGGGLVGTEPMGARRSLHHFGSGDGDASVAAPDQCIEDLPFPGQGLSCRVAGRAVAFMARQPVPPSQPGGHFGR